MNAKSLNAKFTLPAYPKRRKSHVKEGSDEALPHARTITVYDIILEENQSYKHNNKFNSSIGMHYRLIMISV